MIRLFWLLIVGSALLYCSTSRAQTCCSQGGGIEMLAMNKDFQDAHPAPEPFAYTPPATGSMLRFETLEAGKQGNAYYLPSDKPTDKVLILFHEWWGLNDYIKKEAENWQRLLGNVDVYAIDLYDGKVADSANVAGKLSKELDPKRAEIIIKGLLGQVGKNKLVATLGWCLGGTWAFTAGVLAEKQSAGVVMYYGFPETDPKRMNIMSDVLYLRATKDKFITDMQLADLQKGVETAGKKFTIQPFDAEHAFANPSNPKHDKLAAKLAEQMAQKFLKEKLAME